MSPQLKVMQAPYPFSRLKLEQNATAAVAHDQGFCKTSIMSTNLCVRISKEEQHLNSGGQPTHFFHQLCGSMAAAKRTGGLATAPVAASLPRHATASTACKTRGLGPLGFKVQGTGDPKAPQRDRIPRNVSFCSTTKRAAASVRHAKSSGMQVYLS